MRRCTGGCSEARASRDKHDKPREEAPAACHRSIDALCSLESTHGGHESPKNDNTWLSSVKLTDPSPLTSAAKGPEPDSIAIAWPIDETCQQALPLIGVALSATRCAEERQHKIQVPEVNESIAIGVAEGARHRGAQQR